MPMCLSSRAVAVVVSLQDFCSILVRRSLAGGSAKFDLSHGHVTIQVLVVQPTSNKNLKGCTVMQFSSNKQTNNRPNGVQTRMLSVFSSARSWHTSRFAVPKLIEWLSIPQSWIRCQGLYHQRIVASLWPASSNQFSKAIALAK